MAPIKRAKPAFSPPRPKKSKTTTAPSTSNTSKRRSTNGAIGTKTSSKKPSNRSRKRARIDSASEEDEDDEDDYGDRSALALVDMQAGDGDDDEDEEEEDEEDTDEAGFIDDTARSISDVSEEPDMILAEITENDEPPSEPIPEALVHKMLQHHFEKPEKTKLSSDARSLVTKYLEVFVREAIMRSSYERQQREQDGDDDDGGGGGGGFLEVEDLERAAVQLCLDF